MKQSQQTTDNKNKYNNNITKNMTNNTNLYLHNTRSVLHRD